MCVPALVNNIHASCFKLDFVVVSLFSSSLAHSFEEFVTCCQLDFCVTGIGTKKCVMFIVVVASVELV